MRKSVKAMMSAGLALLLTSSVSNCLLISDVIGVAPVGGVTVETVVRSAATAAAQGWFHGCTVALDDQNAKFGVLSTTDCNNGYNQGAEPIALYATAARNAANDMIAIAKANKHGFYADSGVNPCRLEAFLSSYALTAEYLIGTINVSQGNAIGPDDLALSTKIGVAGAAEACFGQLTGTGRVISIGDPEVNF